jgi:hypothetical protein
MFLRLSLTLIAVVATTALLTQWADAAIRSNTIDPDATLKVHGRHAMVGGPIICDAGEQLRIHLTVWQESSGAYGEGRTQVWCTGELQQWSVRVVARGTTPFEAGAAEACAVGVTRHLGTTTDEHEWCAAHGITLE